MAGRPIIALLSLILLAAGILFELFIILSGVISVTPFGQSYFISASTSNLPNAPSSPRVGWAYFSLVRLGSGSNAKSMGHETIHPAFPFQPRTNFDVSSSMLTMLPESLRSGHLYYYLSRFAWAFYLVALFFAACALVTGLLALCSRIGGFLSGFFASVAAFFMALAAALMTAWTVKGCKALNGSPTNANCKLSKYGYGFTWAAVACYFLCMILFCASGAAGGKKEATYKESSGMFGRKRSQRSKDGIRSEYS